MNNEGTSLSEKLSIIEENKHDITSLVCGTLLDPIHFMDSRAATQLYFKEKSSEHARIKSLAEEVSKFLTEKWRDERATEEDQISQINANIAKLDTEIIPAIEAIISYYDSCLNKKAIYFNSEDKGKKVCEKMVRAKKRAPALIEDLKRIKYAETQQVSNVETYYLLELVQEVLDDIDADVEYIREDEIYLYKIATDKEMLQDRVLHNIANNIKRHAFGPKQYQRKRLWEKKVRVKISISNGQYYIYISNNGAPFKGNINKVFDLGYVSGAKKNDGYGMYNAKKYIEELGGSIDFEAHQDDEYKVTIILKLPVNE